MDTPLKGPRAKLARATEHLESIEIERALFLARKPYEVACERETETEWVFRLKISHELDYTRVAILIGDFIHNVRSALDQLVWQLVALQGSRPGHTQFPIFVSRNGTKRDGSDAYIKRGRAMLDGLPAKYEAIIERAQPYHRQDPLTHPLHLLNAFSNQDKHRLPVVTLSMLEGMRNAVFTTNRDAEPVETVHREDPWVEDGTELVRAKVNVTGPDPQVRMHGALTLDIATEQGLPLLETLIDIHKVAALLITEAEVEALTEVQPVTPGHDTPGEGIIPTRV